MHPSSWNSGQVWKNDTEQYHKNCYFWKLRTHEVMFEAGCFLYAIILRVWLWWLLKYFQQSLYAALINESSKGSFRDRSLFITGVVTADKMVGERHFLGRQRLGNKKLDKAKWWVIISNTALIYINLAKNISVVRFFSLEAMTAIKILLRGLGKLNFVLLNVGYWIFQYCIYMGRKSIAITVRLSSVPQPFKNNSLSLE